MLFVRNRQGRFIPATAMQGFDSVHAADTIDQIADLLTKLRQHVSIGEIVLFTIRIHQCRLKRGIIHVQLMQNFYHFLPDQQTVRHMGHCF